MIDGTGRGVEVTSRPGECLLWTVGQRQLKKFLRGPRISTDPKLTVPVTLKCGRPIGSRYLR